MIKRRGEGAHVKKEKEKKDRAYFGLAQEILDAQTTNHKNHMKHKKNNSNILFLLLLSLSKERQIWLPLSNWSKPKNVFDSLAPFSKQKNS